MKGSIRTILEAFDLAMEKETAYSNLVGSGDELLLMASAGVQDDLIQRISSVVCENMKNEVVRECDINNEHEPIPINFLINHQYGGQGNFPTGNNTHFSDDYKGHKAYNETNHGPGSNNQQNGFYNGDQYRSALWWGRRRYYIARPHGRGFARNKGMGETSANKGHKSDHQNDQKFNCKVPSGYDTKIGQHTGSDAAQVAEDYHPPDVDYWEEILPQFALDDAIADRDLIVEEVSCNMVQLESGDVQCVR